MRLLKQITILFIGIAFITSAACKKYPDGPLISFHSKEHRVVGTWIVDYYSINGYDSTNYLHAQPYYGKYLIASEVNGDTYVFVQHSDNGMYGTSGHWKFTDSKKDLNIQQTDGSTRPQFNTNPYIASDVTWEIRRLTDANLWLKTTYGGKEYFMKLKQ